MELEFIFLGFLGLTALYFLVLSFTGAGKNAVQKHKDNQWDTKYVSESTHKSTHEKHQDEVVELKGVYYPYQLGIKMLNENKYISYGGELCFHTTAPLKKEKALLEDYDDFKEREKSTRSLKEGMSNSVTWENIHNLNAANEKDWDEIEYYFAMRHMAPIEYYHLINFTEDRKSMHKALKYKNTASRESVYFPYDITLEARYIKRNEISVNWNDLNNLDPRNERDWDYIDFLFLMRMHAPFEHEMKLKLIGHKKAEQFKHKFRWNDFNNPYVYFDPVSTEYSTDIKIDRDYAKKRIRH